MKAAKLLRPRAMITKIKDLVSDVVDKARKRATKLGRGGLKGSGKVPEQALSTTKTKTTEEEKKEKGKEKEEKEKDRWELSLPDDILLIIASMLKHESPTDAINFMLTCKRMHLLVLPVIYRSIQLLSFDAWKQAFSVLKKYPDMLPRIKTLVIMPFPLSFPERASIEKLVFKRDKHAGLVIKGLLEIAPRMLTLETFYWACNDMPKNDELWTVLRKSCPALRHVGTGMDLSPIKTRPCHGDSEMYKLHDLRALYIWFEACSIEKSTGTSAIVQPSKSFSQFLDRCPNLERLHLFPCSKNTPVDFSPILRCRCPRLRFLKIGPFNMLKQPGARAAHYGLLSDFLTYHVHLEEVTIEDLDIADLDLPPEALPNLKHVDSLRFLLKMSKETRQKVQSAEVALPFDDYYETVSALVPMADLRCLTITLKENLSFWPEMSLEKLFVVLLAEFPVLEKLEVVCTAAGGTESDRIISELLPALQISNTLRTLSLKVNMYDGDLVEDAVDIFNASRHTLRALKLTYTPTTASVKGGGVLAPRRGQFSLVETEPPTLAVREVGVTGQGPKVYRRVLESK